MGSALPSTNAWPFGASNDQGIAWGAPPALGASAHPPAPSLRFWELTPRCAVCWGGGHSSGGVQRASRALGILKKRKRGKPKSLVPGTADFFDQMATIATLDKEMAPSRGHSSSSYPPTGATFVERVLQVGCCSGSLVLTRNPSCEP